MITPEETAELERLLADATDAPWREHDFNGRPCVISPAGDAELGNWMVAERVRWKHDAALIVFLRNHADALLAAARQAEAKDARIAELEDELAEMTFERNGYRALTDGSSEAFGKQFGEDMKALNAARLADPSPNAGGGGAG